MNKKINLKSLVICIIIPLAIGGLAALLTMGSMQDFEALNKPPLSPPAWLFPVVWTLLYSLMGVASYLVLEAPSAHGAKKTVPERIPAFRDRTSHFLCLKGLPPPRRLFLLFQYHAPLRIQNR